MTSPIKRQLYQNKENPPQIQVANLYDSCVCEFAYAFVSVFACAIVREFVFLQHLSFTGQSSVLGNYHPVKIRTKTERSFFTQHCSSSLSCMKDCMAIDSGVYVYEQPSRLNCCVADCFPAKLRWC